MRTETNAMRTTPTLLLLLFTAMSGNAQVLVDSIPYPGVSFSFWGIHVGSDTIFLGADGPGDVVFSDPSGNILGQLPTGHTFNHGLVRKPDSYLIAKDYTSSGAILYEVGSNGAALNNWTFPDVFGGPSSGIGDLCADGDAIWYTMYFPDFDNDPFAYAYKWIPGDATAIDTVPMHGEQPYGIALKGDTLFYVTDNLNGDQERIYAYDLTNEQDLGWIELPDTPIDNDMSPRGMFYDGTHLYLIANRQGSNAFAYQTIYIYEFDPNVGFAEWSEANGSLLVYPSPATDRVTVELPFDGSTGTALIEVFDGAGHMVHQDRGNTKRFVLDVGTCNAGTYLLKATVGERSFTRTFVVH